MVNSYRTDSREKFRKIIVKKEDYGTQLLFTIMI